MKSRIAARGLLAPAQELLRAGAHVDSLTGGSEGGQTPLHYALFGFFEGQADMVRGGKNRRNDDRPCIFVHY